MGRTTTKTLTAIIERMVDNPLDTDAQIYARQTVGKIAVQSNELTRIGALCFIPNRLPHHEMSAQRFKNEYEALYGNVTPAVDPSNVPVDTSTRHDSATNNMVSRIDRADSILGAMAILDKTELNLMLSAICMGIPSRDMVSKDKNGRGDWRQAQERNRSILHALNRLSKHWGYIGREAA